ncbi:hypothetical protein MBLNU459_g7324t1 [Dothideomycetes sp. NU459]
MSKSEAMAKRLADHGRHVFVYNHVYTNQVVYSLERSLNNNAALSQLPFAGKKTLPSSLRKDIWRPLLSVSFPSPPQGLAAFRKLREYRRLHETLWDKTLRPDPKKESLDDHRLRNALPSKKERGKIIMDQKANSIADLAQVLREQEALGLEKERRDREKQENQDRRIREELIALAEEERNGGLPVLEQAIAAQEQAIATLKEQKAAAQPDAPNRRTIHQNVIALNALRIKKEKMLAAKAAIEDAKAAALEQGKTSGADSVELSITPPLIFHHPDPATRGTLPKRGPLRKAAAEKDTPVYSTSGVTIRWTNPLDADFAEFWPEAVVHEAAGLVRHTAPAPGSKAIYDLGERPWRRSEKYANAKAKAEEEYRLEQLRLEEERRIEAERIAREEQEIKDGKRQRVAPELLAQQGQSDEMRQVR